ncbi:hypothetical protein J6590_084232 [Homalodisca vitripennis]|nr:hypothetical protein J6590_084232 [Homalodisca vitripennis]
MKGAVDFASHAGFVAVSYLARYLSFAAVFNNLYCGTFTKDVNYPLYTSSILQDPNQETVCHIQIRSDFNLRPQAHADLAFEELRSRPRDDLDQPSLHGGFLGRIAKNRYIVPDTPASLVKLNLENSTNIACVKNDNGLDYTHLKSSSAGLGTTDVAYRPTNRLDNLSGLVRSSENLALQDQLTIDHYPEAVICHPVINDAHDLVQLQLGHLNVSAKQSKTMTSSCIQLKPTHREPRTSNDCHISRDSDPEAPQVTVIFHGPSVVL